MIVQHFIAAKLVQRFVCFESDAAFRAVFVRVDSRGCELAEFAGKVSRKVNCGPERAVNHRSGAGGAVWGGVPVFGVLWRVGLEDRKAVTVTSGWHNGAEVIEMGYGRMKG